MSSGQFQSFWRLLRHRPDFRKLYLGNVVSLLGDWLSYIAVSLVALNDGQGALAIALVYVAHTLPTALVAPISGPLADRFDRKKILIFSYLAAAGITGLMFLAAKAGWVLALQACLLVRGCISGLGITARTASVPMLVEAEELHEANALLGLTWSVMFTTGVALGGFASALLSPMGAIALDVLTFLTAAGITFTLRALSPPKGHRQPRTGLKALVRTWHHVSTIPGARYSLIAKTPSAISNSGGWIALNCLALQSLPQLSLPIALGLLQGVRAVGTGIGPLVPHWLYPRRAHVAVPFVFAGTLIFAYADAPILALLGLLLWGMGTGHNFVNSTAELQAVIPGHILGRVVALDFCLFCSSQALVALLCGLVGDYTGEPRLCAVTATLLGFGFWLFAKRWQPKGSSTQ